MTIQQCKYVLAIARTGSFNEAAKQLFVAQSGLSSSIKQLEGELGIKIFERQKNGAALTHDGAEFLRYAEQLALQSDFIIERYEKDNSLERFSVSTQHYDFVADIFADLLSKCKLGAYSFSLREARTYDVIHDVESNLSDVGIMAIKDGDFDLMLRYLKKKGISFTPFIEAKPHVYLRSSHPLAKRELLCFGDLDDYPYISYEQGSHGSSLFTEEILAISAKKGISITDRATLMNVLLRTNSYTLGTGIMPSLLNDSRVIGIPFDSDDFYHIGYLLKNDRQDSELICEFISMLSAFAEEIKAQS